MVNVDLVLLEKYLSEKHIIEQYYSTLFIYYISNYKEERIRKWDNLYFKTIKTNTNNSDIRKETEFEITTDEFNKLKQQAIRYILYYNNQKFELDVYNDFIMLEIELNNTNNQIYTKT